MNPKPKILAFLLPQFHSIPENDRWWGQGFTEWTNVRKARPIFPGHRQPRAPQNENYYNLLDAETRQWQASLAQSHGLSGFCYYHYWFSGKQLLETPINRVLAEGKPDFPFCFAWANEPWTRTWDGGDHNVLMPQEYGEKSDWCQHFEYLNTAFADPRYLRHNGCPILLIYRPASIQPLAEMLAVWRQLALERGHPGLHIVEMRTVFEDDKRPDLFDAAVNFEPHHSFNRMQGLDRWREKLINKLHWTLWQRFGRSWCVWRSRDARSLWRHILRQDYSAKFYPGAFVNWDNTPRKGKAGTVIRHASPQLFEAEFRKLFERSQTAGAPYIFINAWNEWAEGTYLEPDVENGMGYLEAIKAVAHGNLSNTAVS